MTRSRLAYPLNRGADMDVGGAADLQTDVMRFMAILSLCLVAIFALVQSLPVKPNVAPVTETTIEVSPEPAPVPDVETTLESEPEPLTVATSEPVTLTRPKWVSKYEARAASIDPSPIEPAPAAKKVPINEEPEGFTLQFESDIALTRLVAASQVGVYAIVDTRARRMTVSESRISFWDASLPNSYHEMDASTVPSPVLDALSRTGADIGSVSWGVTLPGKLKDQLENLMQENRGGSLVIGTNGKLRLEAP